MLVYQDAEPKTWLAYSDLHWLAARYGITQLPNIAVLGGVLEALTAKAAKAE